MINATLAPKLNMINATFSIDATLVPKLNMINVALALRPHQSYAQ